MFPTSFLRKFLVVVAAAAVLAACGSSKTNKGGNFSTKGLRPPEASCKVKPSRLGLAEKIRDEMNSTLQKLEDFGGIEEIVFTNFIVQ